MNLKTVFRPFHDADAIEGTVTDRERAEHDRQVREARLEFARRQQNWQEIAETSLVRRGPFLVDSETDAIFVLRRGHVFQPDNASIGYVAPDDPMTWFADQKGRCVSSSAPPARAPGAK